jgi:hypothetical protein
MLAPCPHLCCLHVGQAKYVHARTVLMQPMAPAITFEECHFTVALTPLTFCNHCRIHFHPGHPLLDGPGGHQADGPRPPRRHLVPGLHSH